MKILVTGAAGFLGRALVERLLAHGEPEVRVSVRAPSQRAQWQALAARYPASRVEVAQVNLTSPDQTARAVEGVDTIYHLAASLSGAPADMFLNTVVGSKTLIEAVGSQRPVRIVLVSSFSVYGVAELERGALVDERTPLERHPQKRDMYAQVKLRQELLCRELAASKGIDLVVVRPGVVYGPGGVAISSRVGLELFGVFLLLGGRNILPLSYVENCAEAIVVAGRSPAAAASVFNIHDDDLPTCREYLAAYSSQVRRLRSAPLPYPALMLLSRAVERYHRWSHGQLPAVFTPYKTAASWGGNRFDNARLKSLGWRQLVSTAEGMRRTFAWLKQHGTVEH